MYVLRLVVWKRLEVHGSMALGFVEFEESFDTVPREIVTATLRWIGEPGGSGGWLRACTRRQLQESWWEKEHRRSLKSKLDWGRAAC